MSDRKNSGKLISVIVPVYNSEEYLARCLDSIICQTYKNIEIILINDGSQDGCLDICRKYAEKDSRIIVLDKPNGGQSTARNMGLDKATGDYIGFVDSDDKIELDMYESLITAINESCADIAVCGRYNVYPDGTKEKMFTSDTQQVFAVKETVSRFLTWNGIDGSPCDKLIKRSLCDSLRFPTGYICEDLPFVYKLFEKSRKIVHTGKPKYYYYQRSGSTSHSKYSQKTHGLVIYPKEIYHCVISRWEDLKQQAGVYYFMNVYNAVSVYAQSKESRDVWLEKEISRCVKAIGHNPLIKKKYLVKLFLLRSPKIYCFLKGIKNRLQDSKKATVKNKN